MKRFLQRCAVVFTFVPPQLFRRVQKLTPGDHVIIDKCVRVTRVGEEGSWTHRVEAVERLINGSVRLVVRIRVGDTFNLGEPEHLLVDAVDSVLRREESLALS